MIMRIFLKYRIKRKIEKDPRISKANYRSRSKYSIENAILEKWIIYDYGTLIYQHIMHNITDLKAYYNHQLAPIGSIV